MKFFEKQSINKLIFDENTKIIPLNIDNGKILYINNDTIENLNWLISTCHMISEKLDIEVVLEYKEYEFLLYGNRICIKEEMSKQDINRVYYFEILQNKILDEIINNTTLDNIEFSLKQSEMMILYPKSDSYRKLITSKKLYELYKISEPDLYLDGMVEDAKILIKEKNNKLN